ncbi:MAG: 30S ribosomal protein S5 [Candidatus Sericytochromatia bacterium]|nr:30S ribosomal protein S5 [Candidatus Sericytochromatia bacterium]
MAKPRKKDSDSNESESIEKVIQIRRVTKVVKGGKKLSFRAIVVVGNGRGSVGVGVGKSSEVVGAIQKAITDAKKAQIEIPLVGTTIPHPIHARAGAGKVLLKPAPQGSGVIAGGSIRAVLEAGGLKDVVGKSLGSDSPLNNARATVNALSALKTVEDIANIRGKSVQEIIKVVKA